VSMADSSSNPDERAERAIARKGSHYVGEVLGARYRIVRKVGAGGMADVYEVEHLRLGNRFAAKIPRASADDEGALRRFQREARLLGGLKSDHIVPVFDVSEPDEEPPFMLMELLSGQDLRRLLKIHSTLSVERTVKIGLDACAGLSVVHAAGIVHRDLKPENLFLTHRDSGEELCKLLDFGVIKAAQGTSTQHGGLVGTIRYMAPEQIENAGRVTPQSDVRSLGAILYECLVGKPAFDADSTERLLYQVLNGQPEPVIALRPEVPEGLDAAIMRALERDPTRRFASVRAFADALRPFVGGAASISGESVSTQRDTALAPRRDDRARRLRLRVLVSGGALLISALIWAFASGSSADGEDSASPVNAGPGAHADERSDAEPLRVAETPPAAAVVPAPSALPVAAAAVPTSRVVSASTVARKRPSPAPALHDVRADLPSTAVRHEPTRLRIEANDPYQSSGPSPSHSRSSE
jgi:eukaryotic-like serine/threonine-protein kinase